MERLQDLFLYGDISLDDYVKRSTQLKQQIKEIQKSQPIDANDVMEIGHIIDSISDIWIMAYLEEKREL